VKKPPAWKIQKMYSAKVTLHKVTESEIETDDEFGQTQETEETYIIMAEIQSITLEDMAYLPAGEIKEGDAWGYFIPVYVIEGQDITVEVNDYISFKEIKYLVQRIEDYYEANEVVYRRALLKRQVGQ